MNLNFSPEEERFREEVLEFLREQLTDDPSRGQRLTTTVLMEREIARHWHEVPCRGGWTALSRPREHGGTLSP